MARDREWTCFWSCAVLLLISCCGIVGTTPLRRCYFYDSDNGRNRTCTLTNSGGSCYTYIRRKTDGSFRLKRGCNVDCVNERRNKKIQVCCSTNLCNTDMLTPSNFTVDTPQTTPTFSVATQMTAKSTTATAAPSVTIQPPKLVPETRTPANDNEASSTPGEPSVFLTCNCNQCGSEVECVGAMCMATFEVSADNHITYNYFCSNLTVCPNSTICCNADKCNAEVVRTSTSPTTASGSASRLSRTEDEITTGPTTSPPHPSAKPAVDTSEKYFVIATAVSVVGGVLLVCIILFILACVIFQHRQKTTRVKLLRQSSPSSVGGRSGSIIKPSPSPSFSLTSTASNSDSSNSNSNLSDSYKMDNPLKYLGTRV